MTLRTQRRWILPTLVALALASPSWAEGHPATPVVETLQGVMIEVMKESTALGYDGRLERLQPAIDAAYDLDFMAEKVTGRHWKELSAEQQQQWKALFSDLTAANYAGRFDVAYEGQYFEILGDQVAARDTVMVQTRLVVPDDKMIEFNYRLREHEAGWRIIDVYMNGTVSELALRRSDFATVLKEGGFPELVISVSQRIAKLRAEGGASANAKVGD